LIVFIFHLTDLCVTPYYSYVRDVSLEKHQTNALFPAIRFRSSVQIGSSSIFPFPFGIRHWNGNGATERQCGHGLRNLLRKRIRMNGNVTLFRISI